MMYMLLGRVRVGYDSGGIKNFDFGIVDYVYFLRQVIHRAQRLLGGDDVRYVLL